ncbi:MAG: TIGR00730 family Rossman fold protein [Planctomycetaceae bacterium]
MKRIGVYCGSRSGSDPDFEESPQELGRLIVSCGFGAVYGGGQVGLMGALADAVLENNGSIIGVIPEHLASIELQHPSVTDMRVVGSMHQRKALMIELSDAFIALPGGFGTMEELFEVLCWEKLGLHRNPIGLLNVNGFYDQLVSFIQHMDKTGFLNAGNLDALIVESEPEELMTRIEAALTD